jgi:hypothetical protein
MVFAWYPLILAAELVVLIFYGLGWLAVTGMKATNRALRSRAQG